MVSTSAVSDRRWPADLEGAARNRGTVALRKGVGFLDDAVLLLLVVWLFPLVILLLAAPLVLVVRLLLEIASRT